MIGRPVDHSSRFQRGELADAEESEWLEQEHPEEAMRRRDFLGRTAAVAGSASLAAMLPSDQLVALAAKAGNRRYPLPKPRNLPIDTFVVLMMENRSFDHYFGWHPKADARNAGLRFPDGNGDKISTYRLRPDFQGCEFRDPNHGWDGGRWQYNGGRNDRFVTGTREGDGSDEFAIGYYEKRDLGFIPHVADRYTLYDRWFCSLMASTYPNRHYQWGAQNGGQKSNDLPPETDTPAGFEWETIFDRATKRGLSVGYFASDLPFAALYGQRGIRWTRRIEEFYVRAANGTLPDICFVDPPFGNGGGGDGLSADEHPHGDIRLGQAFMSDIVHAFVESPQYRRGALFIDYDEWGGFFDHVKPPFVPDDRQNRRNLYENWGFTGFRVPGVAVSPYTRGGRVNHMPVTHESILKMISYRYGLGYLNKRHRYASNIARSFDFRRRKGIFEPPKLPTPRDIAATPCSVQGNGAGRDAKRPKPHDMALLESSGLLDRLGYEVPKAGLEEILRYPDTVRRALRRSANR